MVKLNIGAKAGINKHPLDDVVVPEQDGKYLTNTIPVPLPEPECNPDLHQDAFGLIGNVEPTSTRSSVFSIELGRITDDRIRSFTEEVLNIAPEYFYTVPASLSGSFHPAPARTEGGLVKHTKATVKALNSLIRNPWLMVKLTGKPELEDTTSYDICVSAILLHDIVKYGQSDKPGKYDVGHHATAVEFINNVVDFGKYQESLKHIDAILGCIHMHMGPWGEYADAVKAESGFKGLPVLVEACDYISSTKMWDEDR